MTHRLAVAVTLAATGLAACREPNAPKPVLDAFAQAEKCTSPRVGKPPRDRGHPLRLGTKVRNRLLLGTPSAVAISRRDVAYVTLLTAGSAVRLDLPDTTFSAPFAVGARPSQVRMSLDGETAYVANQDAGTITLITVNTNTPFATATVPAGRILNIGVSRHGDRLYALTDAFGVYVFEAPTGALRDSIPASATGATLTGVAFHPFSPCMYVAAREAGTIATVDLRTNTVVARDTVPGAQIENLAVSHDGSTLYATESRIPSHRFFSRDLTTPGAAYAAHQTGNGTPFDVAVTPDNTQVYVSTPNDRRVWVFDRATLQPLDFVLTPTAPRYIGFDASGRTAVVPNGDGDGFGRVSFIHSDPPPPSPCLPPTVGTPPAGRGHPGLDVNEAVPVDGGPSGVAISPTGVTYVTLFGTNAAVRADLPATTFSAPFPAGSNPTYVFMSPDGQTAYVGQPSSVLRQITVIRVATNEVIGTIQIPDGPRVEMMGLSPDGANLYVASDFGVDVISTVSRTVTARISINFVGESVAGMAFHPFSPCVYFSSADLRHRQEVHTFDLTSNTVVRTHTVWPNAPSGGSAGNLAVSRDGSMLFATLGSKLLMRDLTSDTTGFLETDLGGGTRAVDVAVTPDNAQVWLSVWQSGAPGRVLVLDRITRDVIATVETGGTPGSIAFNASGTHAVVSNSSGWVNFIHGTTAVSRANSDN